LQQTADRVDIGSKDLQIRYCFVLALPTQQQELYNFFAVGIANGFQRAASKSRAKFCVAKFSISWARRPEASRCCLQGLSSDAEATFRQHCLYFLPLPQGQGSLRPAFGWGEGDMGTKLW
jgi:hypothetical protein